MNIRFWGLRALKFLFLGALFVGLAGYVTMSLWNWLVPVLFHGPVLSFGQALGLFALSKILLGGFGGGHRRRWQRQRGAWGAKGREMWRQRMESRLATLPEEQRERFRQKFAKCAGKHGWGESTAEATSNQPVSG